MTNLHHYQPLFKTWKIAPKGEELMPIYNKLVRGLFPNIIESDGKTCVANILDDSQYITEVNKKNMWEIGRIRRS